MQLPCPASELGLPHRPPFLFVDVVNELEPGVRCKGSLRLPAETPMFAGHFPGAPLVPGVVLTEAIAQLAGIAAASPGRSFLLGAIRSMKFPAAAHPGETINLEACVIADHGSLVQCEGTATVAERTVASGTIILSAREQQS
jgi:3-hydroxyacyl-[acyl-carrier-protein] dehydratase